MLKIFKKSEQKLIVAGLGNPGVGYKNTRHNVGFEIIDTLCRKLGIELKSTKFNALYAKFKVAHATIILLKPQTFMNNSGMAVGQFAKYYNVSSQNVIVAHDDITLPLGCFKIKQGGSAGGHNGITSIIDFLDSQEFVRLKYGVGAKPLKEMNLADWVLQRFNEDELKTVESSLPDAAEAIIDIINNGVNVAMNNYNSNIKGQN
ncbi:MAG: aminoacyl-tRNA hydrolase [Oscillospiraceae bacterium]